MTFVFDLISIKPVFWSKLDDFFKNTKTLSLTSNPPQTEPKSNKVSNLYDFKVVNPFNKKSISSLKKHGILDGISQYAILKTSLPNLSFFSDLYHLYFSGANKIRDRCPMDQ